MSNRKRTKKTDTEQAKAVARRILEIRKFLGMTQTAFAASLGMTAPYVSMIEGCKSSPGAGFFIKLSQVHDVSLDYMFYGDGEMIKNADKVEFENVEVVDTIEKTIWVMERSPIFKHAVFAYGTKFVAENETIIKRNIEVWKATNRPDKG